MLPFIPNKRPRPAPVLLDHLVDLTHDPNRLAQRHNDLLVVCDIILLQRPYICVYLEPEHRPFVFQHLERISPSYANSVTSVGELDSARYVRL